MKDRLLSPMYTILISFVFALSCCTEEGTDGPDENDAIDGDDLETDGDIATDGDSDSDRELVAEADGDNDEENSIECVTLSGTFPQAMKLPPEGNDGPYDPTLAADPETGRVWMVFSRVIGLAGSGQVSTHLAYSDDNGERWCYSGVVNQSEQLAPEERPGEFVDAVSAHWSHEVPSIAYDPHVPDDRKWRMTWHRYLHVDDGVADNEDRRFQYGWISSRTAADPSLLAAADEEKLFSGAAYYFAGQIETYNDTIFGPPQVKLHELHSDLSGCLAFSETGMQAFDNKLYISILCAGTPGGDTVVLIRQDHTDDSWSYVSTLLTPADAQAINPAWSGFSATDLFFKDSKHYLLVSPVSGLYDGCLLFQLDLETGTFMDENNDGLDVLLNLTKSDGAIQTGVCTYDPQSSETGIIFGDVFIAEPQFRLFASGINPGE